MMKSWSETREPKLEGVLGTTLYYKGFSFGCYLRYQLGRSGFQ
ncbi:MAG: hypothetical protein ACLU4N_00855 [Butyricimonas faecihominis]